VHDIVRLDCRETLNDLSDDDARFLLDQLAPSDLEVIFEVTAIAKLKLQVECALGLRDVSKSDY